MGARGRRVGVDFDPVGEPDTLNELGQLVVAIEPAPAFLRGIDELEPATARCAALSPAFVAMLAAALVSAFEPSVSMFSAYAWHNISSPDSRK